MTPETIQVHLRVVGVLLLGIAALSAYVPRHFGWGRDIAQLPLLTRQVFVIHCAFVTLVLVLLGVLLAGFAPALLAPGPLPRALLVGLLVMWTARMLAQWFFYDPRLWRGIPLNTAMHVLFSGIYAYFVIVLAAALVAQVNR
jgi:small-conductance mechanosensitive channel